MAERGVEPRDDNGLAQRQQEIAQRLAAQDPEHGRWSASAAELVRGRTPAA